MKRLLVVGCALLLGPAAIAQQNTETRESGSRPQLSVQATAPYALPAGTVVKMRLETGVTTASNKPGDTFTGRVTEDLYYQGKVVVPVGSSIQGSVTKVDEKRRIKGRSILELRPEYVTLPDGSRYVMVAGVTGTDAGTKVDNEGRILAPSIDKRDKIEMAVATGGGAGFGALVAHSGKGALIGAVIGGGAAVGYWLSKTKSASLPAGTEITMELSRPMALTAVGD
ncbi:MAG: TrbI/VirB10 family protein [Acidobacteriales bacterium]|nr:TrbI/VirB10 family protein [Terriglobales bacterium]